MFTLLIPIVPESVALNENTNGLIRRYIKKDSSFEYITKEQINFIEDRLNNRPRKSLGYRTPNEVYQQHVDSS
jgi:IS30 family transposase